MEQSWEMCLRGAPYVGIQFMGLDLGESKVTWVNMGSPAPFHLTNLLFSYCFRLWL